MTVTHDPTDLQLLRPDVAVALERVGISGTRRGIIFADGGPATCEFTVNADLPDTMRGAHMSRFHEAIDQALLLVASDGNDAPGIDLLAMVVASRAAELQGCDTANARINAQLTRARVTPESDRRTHEPLDIWGEARVDRARDITHTTLGVQASGMTACPCAQLLVRAHALESLQAAGIESATIDQVLDTVPIATHNQRSTASLEITVPSDGSATAIAAPDVLADLIIGAMSSPIFETLKRDDERHVVITAHENARFVEDCVRKLLRDVATSKDLAHLPSDAVIRVTQRNHESIHAHDVTAERSLKIGDLQALLSIT